MKTLLNIFIASSMLFSSIAMAGESGAHGGDPYVLDFLDQIKLVCQWFKDAKLDPRLTYDQCQSLHDKMFASLNVGKKALITSVDHQLHDENGDPKPALFNQKAGTIVFNWKEWKDMDDQHRFTTAATETSGIFAPEIRYTIAEKARLNWVQASVGKLSSTEGTSKDFSYENLLFMFQKHGREPKQLEIYNNDELSNAININWTTRPDVWSNLKLFDPFVPHGAWYLIAHYNNPNDLVVMPDFKLNPSPAFVYDADFPLNMNFKLNGDGSPANAVVFSSNDNHMNANEFFLNKFGTIETDTPYWAEISDGVLKFNTIIYSDLERQNVVRGIEHICKVLDVGRLRLLGCVDVVVSKFNGQIIYAKEPSSLSIYSPLFSGTNSSQMIGSILKSIKATYAAFRQADDHWQILLNGILGVFQKSCLYKIAPDHDGSNGYWCEPYQQ